MKPVEVKRDDGVELETQVILRLPEEPAKVLREAVREGANNLKDRLSVKLENDLRYGEVRLDHWHLHAKVVDLPSIIESLKTIDNKSFYKTADICQMIICKEEPDLPTVEEESPNKNKKKDPNKVDKKFLWPHGITPPCKNLRKRRFRKTLKKKFVEAPEIEKEVKRLLRADNEAVNCKWDVITEEDDHDKSIQQFMGDMDAQDPMMSMGATEKVKKSKGNKDRSGDRGNDSSQMPRDIDIFGEDLSSSDEDDHHNNINVDLDDSRLSADDSRMSDYSMQGGSSQMKMETEFTDAMFSSPLSRGGDGEASSSRHRSQFYDNERPESDDNDNDMVPQLSQESINERISDLRRQLNDLRNQRITKEQEILSIENQALRQRLQDSLDNILSQILDREMEMQEYQSMLQ
ncbi:transcription initiation factor TFIID subunit 7 [Bradysia coprophila]|uniref:transcription initiation factor TFIID subunit 7 n=1 Tax=Bradysia coprophila TaxID=38358 RepID=UPI00187D8C93|nr:transcription initiation factor TFIID subunit 7 [Bradysia coprophila]